MPPESEPAAAPGTVASWKEQLREQLLATRLTWNDRIMLGLAVLDAILLAVRRDIEIPGHPEWDAAIVTGIHAFDWIVVGIFAVEFLVSFAVTDDRRGFLRANWYDLVGIIPVHSAILRAFRLGRIVRIYIWGSRFPSEVERRFGGEAYVLHVLRKYEPVLIEELTDPLLVRALGALRRVVGAGRYANAVGEGLDARREEIHSVVRDAILKSPALRTAYAFSPVKAGFDEVEKQTLDVAVGALTDPRLDEVIRRSLDDALAGLQRRVEEKEWHRAHGSPAPA